MNELGAQLLDLLRGMPSQAKADLDKALAEKLTALFKPNPGPQTEALLSKADILLYGGAAGGGKSGLLVGAASNHRRAAIFRRQSVELDGLIDFAKTLYGDHAKFNGTDLEFSFKDRDCQIKFGGMLLPGDWSKYRGIERDFIGFDEGGEFLLEQVASLIAWNRSSTGMRTRVVIASNPPTGADGLWMLEWFAPWLDPLYPRPAAPGELRWAVSIAGKTTWVDGPEPLTIDGEQYFPLSRTFIRASLEDNPFNNRPEYRARLASLPEPLRSQLLKGDFLIGKSDADFQVIPSAWIAAAQARWKPDRPRLKMLALGVDIAQGGDDDTVLSPLYGTWFDHQVIRPGVDTKDGPAVAGLVIETMRDGCQINADLTGGWGISARDHLAHLRIEINSVIFSGSATEYAADGRLGFGNMRAQLYWQFREALDPKSGDDIALPPDPRLAAELAAATYAIKKDKIFVEPKLEIRKRLGTSPDRADSIVLAWHDRKRALFMSRNGSKLERDWAYCAPSNDPYDDLNEQPGRAYSAPDLDPYGETY